MDTHRQNPQACSGDNQQPRAAGSPLPIFTSLSAVICVRSPSRIDTVSYKPGFCNGWWWFVAIKAGKSYSIHGSYGGLRCLSNIHSQPRGTSQVLLPQLQLFGEAQLQIYWNSANGASNHELSLLGLHNWIRGLILDATPRLKERGDPGDPVQAASSGIQPGFGNTTIKCSELSRILCLQQEYLHRNTKTPPRPQFWIFGIWLVRPKGITDL